MMKNIKNIKLSIRKKFQEIEGKNDFIDLFNYIQKEEYGEKVQDIDLKTLNYYATPNKCTKRYTTFSIKKKSGKERIINAPVPELKKILRIVNIILQCLYEPHKASTGFVQGKSIVDNAKKHIDSTYVYNIDLKDFFHSFDKNRVKIAFMMKPFNLKGKIPSIPGLTEEFLEKNNTFVAYKKEWVAYLLASLCTHPFEVDGEMKEVLPQGSPTSPTITNIICLKLDRRLTGLAKRFGAKYTRYADDITFSSMKNVFKKKEFLDELHRIIKEDNKWIFPDKTITIGPELKINEKKTRLQKNVHRQEVTGLIVNEKVNVHRRYIKQMRMWLYYWERYGYEKATQLFIGGYKKDKGHIKKGNPDLRNVLDGKLEYLKMVKGGK